MNKTGFFTTSSLLKGIFVVAIFILFFSSGVSYKHTIAIAESTELLIRSYKTQILLEQLKSKVKHAETNERGFIITRDSSFLQPYNSALEELKEPLFSLQYLTVENQQQRKNLDSLVRLVNLRIALLDSTLDLTSKSGYDREQLGKNMITGKNVMDQIRNQMNKMVDLEIAHFNKHQKIFNRDISFTPIVTLSLFIVTMIFLFISYLKIDRDLDVQKRTNEKLLILVESIKHAEIIGEFGISQWDIKTGKLFYSDNLYALLGCEPQSFEPTIANYLNFVHPDDQYIVTRGAENAVQSNCYPREYRIIRKDGEIRYFRSMGKFITDNEKSRFHIGVGRDITQQHLNELAILERNRELEHIINELESFNRVASHDLQEPLRKIQTFISRISDNDLSAMSESSKEYFSKIKIAVSRMRKLIDDLLLFSRTNKIEKIFENTDFNLILENVRQELSQTIEEKNAVLSFTYLPTLNVIPFQIQQLFINLIGNSLKYSNPNISPEIKIECEKISAGESPAIGANNSTNYYKITVTDNGLGFEQEFADHIFILFQRLHNKSEYPGTGIGLAICKKIMENHNGSITAIGTPGIGSTFSVFFPV